MKLEVIIVVIAFIIYLTWAATLPITCAPDENSRFDISLYIQFFGSLPTGGEPLIRNPIWGMSYAYTPYGASLLAVPFVYLASLFTKEVSVLLFAARMVSVLCATGTVITCLLIGRRVFRLPATRILFAVLVGFLPQFVFLASYFNSDMFSVFSTALIFYFWIRGLGMGWDRKSCLGLGASIGLCLMSYYFAYGFVLVSVILFFGSQMQAWRTGSKNSNKPHMREVAVKTLWVLAPVLLLAGWFFMRNAILYHGDLLGMAASRDASEMYAIQGYKPSQRGTFSNQGLSVFDMLANNNYDWIKTTIKSFIGTFSYMLSYLPPWLYYAYFFLFFLGFLATVFYCCGGIKKKALFLFCCLLCIIIPIVLSVYYSFASDYGPQGRYIMSIIVPLFFLFSIGFEKAAVRILGEKKGGISLYVISGVFVVFFCVAVFTAILPTCIGEPMQIYTNSVHEDNGPYANAIENMAFDRL